MTKFEITEDWSSTAVPKDVKGEICDDWALFAHRNEGKNRPSVLRMAQDRANNATFQGLKGGLSDDARTLYTSLTKLCGMSGADDATAPFELYKFWAEQVQKYLYEFEVKSYDPASKGFQGYFALAQYMVICCDIFETYLKGKTVSTTKQAKCKAYGALVRPLASLVTVDWAEFEKRSRDMGEGWAGLILP